MANLNEDLAYMGSMAKKIEATLHDLQYLAVSQQDLDVFRDVKRDLLNLTTEITQISNQLRDKYREEPTELKPFESTPALRTSELFTKLRKFDGKD